MKNEAKAREDIVEIGRRMHQQGMASGQDGNISVRLNEREVLITPSRVPKGYLTPSHIIKVDLEGNKRTGDLMPSVETPMHLAAYQAFPKITAGIHAHPIFTIVLSIAGVALSVNVLPEIATVFGRDIPIAKYVTPGTPEMGSILVPLLKQSSLVILERHGTFSAGEDIYDAWYKTEQIEGCAKVLYYAHRLGDVPEIPKEEVARLLEIHQRLPKTPR